MTDPQTTKCPRCGHENYQHEQYCFCCLHPINGAPDAFAYITPRGYLDAAAEVDRQRPKPPDIELYCDACYRKHPAQCVMCRFGSWLRSKLSPRSPSG